MNQTPTIPSQRTAKRRSQRVRSLNLSALRARRLLWAQPACLSQYHRAAKAVLTEQLSLPTIARATDREKPVVRDARTAKMTPARFDGGAWLYSHPRSPKAARSTPAGAYHPPAR